MISTEREDETQILVLRFLWADFFCDFRDPAGRITHSADLKMASLLVHAGADPSCGLTDLLEFHINLVKDDEKGPDDCGDSHLTKNSPLGWVEKSV